MFLLVSCDRFQPIRSRDRHRVRI